MIMNKICGIYKITNKINGMEYCGQSIDCRRRWIEHIKPSKNHTPIDKAINEFGKENFTFSILLECPPDMLDVWERDMINLHDTLYPKGYNYQGGGKLNYTDVCEETRLKRKESLSGEKNPMYGKTPSESTRRRKSELMKGKNTGPRSEECKKKMSENQKGKGTDLKPKYKYLTPSGEIVEGYAHLVSHWHKDWIRIEE